MKQDVAMDIVSDPGKYYGESANFTDWRLPTCKELELMYKKWDEIGGFGDGKYYWSSVIHNDWSGVAGIVNWYAYYFDLQLGGKASLLMCNAVANVRVVRSF